jgi:hypothetical protein
MNRLGDPGRTVELTMEVEVPLEQLWRAAAGSVRDFFSHQPGFAGLTHLNTLGSDEGGRYIVHRIIDGVHCDRIGEVLLNMPMSQLTVSDLDMADPSVAGWFPALYTLQVEEEADVPGRSIVHLSCTVLGIPGGDVVHRLGSQMCSILRALHAPIR